MLRRDDLRKIRPHLNGWGFNFLLEIVARLTVENLKEIPYAVSRRRAGEWKLFSMASLQYLGQLWRLSFFSRYISVRFIKFALVGSSGVIINLCVFLALSQVLGIHDSRIQQPRV